MLDLTKTKSRAIYDELKKEILSGKLAPETHLVIKQIANRFGVSDIPVREAIKELTSEGLIETIPHIGSRVAEISYKKLNEILVMRECLEPFAAKLAVSSIDEKTIEQLETYNNEIKKAFEKGDKERCSAINRKFHVLIYTASNNELLIKTISQLMDNEKRMKNIFQYFPELLATSLQEHSAMIKYLKERNGDLMADVMYKHKKRAYDKMRAYFEQKS